MDILMNKEKLLEDELIKHVVQHRIFAPFAFHVNLADLHWGLNDIDLVKAAVEMILSVQGMTCTLGGDSMNFITKTSKGNLLEEDVSGDKQLLQLAEVLKPLVTEGRLLGIIEGNHPARAKEAVYVSPEAILAHLLGKPDLYKGELLILYYNVNKNCYVHFVQHKCGKGQEKFTWMSADVVWREHVHDHRAEHRFTIEHNKYLPQKRPIVKQTFEIYSGSFQIYPGYSKASGYRPLIPGCMIAEMSGGVNKWKIRAWRDEDLIHAISRGYQI